MGPVPTDSELLSWIFARNVTVLQRAGGGFACLYRGSDGRTEWGPSAKSKRDAVLAAINLRRTSRGEEPDMTEPQGRGLD